MHAVNTEEVKTSITALVHIPLWIYFCFRKLVDTDALTDTSHVHPMSWYRPESSLFNILWKTRWLYSFSQLSSFFDHTRLVPFLGPVSIWSPPHRFFLTITFSYVFYFICSYELQPRLSDRQNCFCERYVFIYAAIEFANVLFPFP